MSKRKNMKNTVLNSKNTATRLFKTTQVKKDTQKKTNWKKVISITLNEEEIEKLDNFIKEFNENTVLKINRSITIRELIKQKLKETNFK